MKLQEWKDRNRYQYKHMADMSGIKEATLMTITTSGQCKKLSDAAKISVMTDGQVSFRDLLGAKRRETR